MSQPYDRSATVKQPGKLDTSLGEFWVENPWDIVSKGHNLSAYERKRTFLNVRDPQGGLNLALLSGRAFAKPRPLSQRTWHIRLSAAGAQAVCEQPRARITFDRTTFAADPRIAALRWER